ncbi:MAG: hypothetical protein IJM96_04510 [Clostridia bacterium]|nr:hypothetical protein [Clostridia bacterium]
MTDFTMDYYMISKATNIEGMNMETYGVRLVQTYSDGRVETLSLPDITPHRSKMEKLIEMMKRGMVTIMTAEEIVEDFLEM